MDNGNFEFPVQLFVYLFAVDNSLNTMSCVKSEFLVLSRQVTENVFAVVRLTLIVVIQMLPNDCLLIL